MKTMVSAPPSVSSDTSSFNAITSRYSHHFRGMTHEEVWKIYHTPPNDSMRNYALEELLYRQNGILASIAQYTYRAHSDVGRYEDFLGLARYRAICSYDKYDINMGYKLNTYVGQSVRLWLNGQADEMSLIKSPAYRKGFRTYLSGGYDDKPEKKEKFELRNTDLLTNDEKMSRIRSQCDLMETSICSYDQYITNEDGHTIERDVIGIFQEESSDIDKYVDKFDWEEAISGLSKFQQDIYTYYFREENTVNGVAVIMNIEEKEVRKQIRLIKLHLGRRFLHYGND